MDLLPRPPIALKQVLPRSRVESLDHCGQHSEIFPIRVLWAVEDQVSDSGLKRRDHKYSRQ